MACEEYREIIDRFVENLATEEEKKDLEGHMRTCGECRSEVEDISRMLKAFNSFESVDLPDDLMSLLHERLLKISAESTKKERNIFVFSFIKKLAAIMYYFYRINSKVVAAGICAVLISFFLGRFSAMPASFKYGINTAGEPQMIKTQTRDDSSAKMPAPTISEQNSTEQNTVDYNKTQPDDGSVSEKRLAAAINKPQSETENKQHVSQDEKDVKQDAAQEIQREKQENIQKDTAVSASGDVAVRSTELTRSSRNGMAKEYASAKNATQYKFQQESGPTAAAAPSPLSKSGGTCDILVRVDDFDKKVVFAISLAHQLGGDIQKAEIIADNGDGSRTAYIVMKIPLERADSALEQIEALGEMEKSCKATQSESATQESETMIMQISIIEKNMTQTPLN